MTIKLLFSYIILALLAFGAGIATHWSLEFDQFHRTVSSHEPKIDLTDVHTKLDKIIYESRGRETMIMQALIRIMNTKERQGFGGGIAATRIKERHLVRDIVKLD